MSKVELTLIEELILLELAAGKPGAARTQGELRSAVFRSAGSNIKADIAPAFARLAGLGLMEELPRALRARSSRWRILSPGEEALRDALAGLYARRGRTFKQKAARALAARRSLGLAPRAAAALAEPGALAIYFLAARLGEEFQPGMTLDALARRAAAAALGLSNDQPETLWRAILQRAMAGGSADITLMRTPSPSPEEDQHPPAALGFPSQIGQAADAAREGWFGPRKLFIHRAWEAWKATSGETADLSSFKARLLESLHAGHLGLARADFTAGLHPADLEQAETRYGSEVFHFINFAHDRHQG